MESTTHRINLECDQPMSKAIILFDGVCNLCTWSVQFILHRDPQGYFQFAALQSSIAQKMLDRYEYATSTFESVVLVENQKVYRSSEAALRIARHLKGGWAYLGLLRIFPRGLREWVYTWIATHRYQWFGQRLSCMTPTPDIQARFLDTPNA